MTPKNILQRSFLRMMKRIIQDNTPDFMQRTNSQLYPFQEEKEEVRLHY